jgi:hypothetical protein
VLASISSRGLRDAHPLSNKSPTKPLIFIGGKIR